MELDTKDILLNKEIDFEHFVNKHKNEKCVIVGGSQTMHDFDYENFNGKKIVLGTAILRLENRFNPDYLISANNHMPVPEIDEHLKILNSYKNMTWIFSDTAVYCDIWTKSESFLNENLKINYSCYDDRHFGRKKCNPEKKCCSFLNRYPLRKNIYDILVEKSSLNKDDFTFGMGASVAEGALAIAILMGFKEIYLQGVSLTLDNKYQFLRDKNQKYFGYPSKYADDLLYRTSKPLRKKFFFYYLKKLDFMPYISSYYERTVNYFFNRSVFRKNHNQSMLNFSYLAKISKLRSQKIYCTSENSNLKNIENIHFINTKFGYLKKDSKKI